MALDSPLHLDWPLHALRQSLPGLDVRFLPEVDSTNSALLAQHKCAADRAWGDRGRLGHLWVAERQTQGRGRLGRPWQSAAGASLTFSMSTVLAPQDWSGLSLAVGVALAEALERWLQSLAAPAAAAPKIGLKWPNDLMRTDPAAPLGARKLGGILIETAAVADSTQVAHGQHRRPALPGESAGGGAPRLCVVGVGLNVRPQALHGLSSGYACLQEWAPAAQAPGALLALAADLWAAVRCFEALGFAPFADRFAQRDILLGRAVQTLAPAADTAMVGAAGHAANTAGVGPPAGLVGWARGVDTRGVMQIEGADGQLHGLSSGELSLRAADAATPVSGAHPC